MAISCEVLGYIVYCIVSKSKDKLYTVRECFIFEHRKMNNGTMELEASGRVEKTLDVGQAQCRN